MDDLMLEFAAELRTSFGELAPLLTCWRDQPNDQQVYDAVFRHLHTAKAGAGFVRMARIEALAAAAEQGLADRRHWALADNPRHTALIVFALERIDAIAQAIELGIGYPTLGEDELITDLLGQPRAMTADAMPFDPTQIRSVRLSLSILDSLIVQAEALDRSLLAPGFMSSQSCLAELHDDMHAHVAAIRALRYAPAAQLFDGLSTYVGQLAVSHGRVARLSIAGDTVWLDRAHIPVLRYALCHLLRNAIAHGIEAPEERRRRRKHECGQIMLSASCIEQTVRVSLTDDGGGVDYAALAAEADGTAGAVGLLTRPGISTAGVVSDIAGRGVGLDSVRIALERLDGALELYDHPGEGFTATLILPAPAVAADG